MRKSKNIRTYAFLLHDLPMKFCAHAARIFITAGGER